MALIKCLECGREVSDTAEKCPSCGHKISSNSGIRVSAKFSLIISIIYTICVCIYANDYLWNTSSIIMFVVGLALIGLMVAGQKVNDKIHSYLFAIIYIVGAFVFTFEYNITRMDIDYIDGGFFSSHIYRYSIGGFLAVFQIISVVSVILLCMAILMPKICTKFASLALFISGIIGMVFHIYNKVYLNANWGTASHSTFYIWLGITTFCFYMIGATYLLTNKKENN